MAHTAWTGHAASHWNGQAHVLSVMNAKTRVAQRLHARFRPLAYAARSRPRGSIGSPPGREAGVYVIRSGSHQIRSGHVSAPDPAWVLIKARVCSVLEPWDPTVGGPDPIQGVRVPFQGSGSHTWRSWTKLGGPDRIYRGPAPSHGVRTHW
jgi:hypothetical protein